MQRAADESQRPVFLFYGDSGNLCVQQPPHPVFQIQTDSWRLRESGRAAVQRTRFSIPKTAPLTPSGSVLPRSWGGSRLFVWNVLHQIAGLTIKDSTDFFFFFYGQVLYRPRTNCRNGRRTYPGQISQLLLIDLFQGKLYPHAELDHRITPFQAGLYHELSYFTTVCVKKF